MFCPNCRTEYREGFSVCADCNIELVHELYPEVQFKKINYYEVIINVLSKIISFVIILFSGVFGILANLYFNTPEGPTYFFVFIYFIIASLIIGFLEFKNWKISILNSCGSVLVGFALFFNTISEGDFKHAVFCFISFFMVPFICLFFGYVGSRLRFKRYNKKFYMKE